jgi:hypothetical protein
MKPCDGWKRSASASMTAGVTRGWIPPTASFPSHAAPADSRSIWSSSASSIAASRRARSSAACCSSALPTVIASWCFQTDGLDAVAAPLRPDGVALKWRAAGLADSPKESWLPFFVVWDDPARHPGLTPVKHRLAPLGIAAAVGEITIA